MEPEDEELKHLALGRTMQAWRVSASRRVWETQRPSKCDCAQTLTHSGQDAINKSCMLATASMANEKRKKSRGRDANTQRKTAYRR